MVLACADPSIDDAPVLAGEALTRRPDRQRYLEAYYRWLRVRHPGNLEAIRDLAIACTANGQPHANLTDLQYHLLTWAMADHPGRIRELLDAPALYRALGDRHYWTVRPYWMHPKEYGWRQADYAIMLWRMGHLVEARAAADQAGDQELARMLKYRTTLGLRGRDLVEDLTDDPGKGAFAVSVAAFRAAIDADPVVAAYDRCRELVGRGDPQCVSVLTPAMVEAYPVVADLQAEALAAVGRRGEAMDLVERTIERFGRQARDALCLRLALGTAATPAEVERGFACLSAHPDQLLGTEQLFELTAVVRNRAVHDRVLALVDPRTYGRSNAFDLAMAELPLDTGDGAAQAAELFISVRQRQGVSPAFRGWAVICQSLAARVAARPDLEPSPADLREPLGTQQSLPGCDALLRCLVGDLDRAGCISACQQATGDGEVRLYHLALLAIAQGQLQQASQDLKRLIETHRPDAGGARRLLEWLARRGTQPSAAGSGDF
ncbi:MAG TPA: hypothetical protein DCS97_01935 [Planctomycetes bacterium]|nr:hypothetical protein [Planctomycetota bacterium]